jgi:tRNA pseudouridine13 synthase
MSFDPLLPPPLLTADLPGIGGVIKQQIDDFEVEEVPAYEASGQGDFLYLWIEKRDMGAEYFQRQLARRLGIAAGEVGCAGLKDRRAITRQMVSVPAHVEERLKEVEGEGIRLLGTSRHSNKLRPGHLRGNRFRILVRAAQPGSQALLVPIIDRLRSEGMPNFYGAQRFGKSGETVLLGLALLRGDKGGSVRQTRNPFLRKLALSAAQSALFNHSLAGRMAAGLYRRIVPGDVMARWPMGGIFVAEDLAIEQARFDRRETVHAGPIFGRKTFRAAQDAAAREDAVLSEAGLSPASFRNFGKLLQGTRRHNLVYLDDLAHQSEPEGERFTFTLPAGSYATVLMRELMKTDQLESEEPSAEAETL